MEIDEAETNDIYRLQLAASKITKRAIKGNTLDETKDRIVSLQAWLPDESSELKEKEAASAICAALLTYQKEIAKNGQVFAQLAFCDHVTGVFLSSSETMKSGTIDFFDPNSGVFQFISFMRTDRFENFASFLQQVFCKYKFVKTFGQVVVRLQSR